MGKKINGDLPTARVLALAKEIGDEPFAWEEREDGSVLIVFTNKGKRLFEPEPKKIIHTKKEAEEAVKTLPPKKNKEK